MRKKIPIFFFAVQILVTNKTRVFNKEEKKKS